MRALSGTTSKLRTAEGVDVGHARHRPELGPDHPVEQAAPLLQRQLAAFDGEHEHFAQRGRHRRNSPGDIRRQAAPDAVQALRHLLSRPVDIGAVLEIYCDVRERVFRHRAQHGLVRQAQHLHFDGRGDARLDFLRRHARCLGDNLDLGRRNVGEGIDWQILKRIAAHPDQQGRQHEHQQALR
jgi:hypothetical protein